MAGKSFLKKNPGKGAGGILKESATRSVGTIAAAYAANNLLNKVPMIKPEYKGAVMLLLGMAAEVLVDNSTVKNFAEGISAYGALQTTGDLIMKTKKAQLGLAGIEGGPVDTDYKDVTKDEAGKPMAGIGAYDWSDALAGAAQEKQEMEAEIQGAERRAKPNESGSISDMLM